MIKKILTLSLMVFTVFSVGQLLADASLPTIRGETKLADSDEPPLMPKVENRDLKRTRDYPQAAPTIPHEIEFYQLNKDFNRCLSCHGRLQAEASQAPVVSITHYMNRERDFLASVTPARYFCTQCHVVQHDVKPLVENKFIDMDVLSREQDH